MHVQFATALSICQLINVFDFRGVEKKLKEESFILLLFGSPFFPDDQRLYSNIFVLSRSNFFN